ncbi:MAG: PIN domain-containing protein [Clostridiales Family XIII bacterium]|jgi:uncharacterized protein YacL|nr:PIN domain-containing protein [Clostridiales Family XIII bacterium]
MLKNLIRGAITVLGFGIGVGIFMLLRHISAETKLLGFLGGISGTRLDVMTVAGGIIIAVLLFLLTPALTKLSSKFAGNIEREIRHLSAQDLIAGVAGLVIGLIIAYLISPVARMFENSYASVIITVAVYIIFIWLGVVIGTRKGKDVIALAANTRKDIMAGRGGTPARAAKNSQSTSKILDTSVIIDGRIADILKTGFLEGKIIIPDFVLVELRHIADSSDNLKRNRGRRGLDILHKIQNDFGIEIYATAGEKSLEEIPEVDVKLLKLAQNMKGKVVTNDFNLNKVAMIQGVSVLNINELANNLKPVVLPGEEMTLFLVKEGKEQSQAVAYLDDGTMIVVEDGRKQIGKTVAVNVTSVLQTSAGRMIFARLK